MMINRIAGAMFAVVLAAGCSSDHATPSSVGNISAMLGGPRSPVTPATRTKLLYIARYSYDVQVYDSATLALLGDITGFTNPQGIAIDSRRNLYVVDQGKGDVLVFHRNAKTPFETLSDPDGIPFQVVVRSDGTVYVSNEYNFSLGNGNVAEYAPGSTSPTGEITDPNFNLVEDVGLDSKNNLYVTYDNPHVVGKVNEYSPGSTRGKTLPFSLGGAGGIAFDRADDIVVCDTTAPAVKVFAQGASTPKYEFGTKETDPWDVALAARATRAFVTNPFSGNTYEYALPNGRKLHTITNPSGTSGVAVEQ
jgi:hypothetical protein